MTPSTTPEPFTIRDAVAEDAGAITALHALGWRSGYADAFEPRVLERAIEDRRARWTSLVAGPDFADAILVVAHRGSELVGFAHAGAARGHPGDAEIYSFYVHPDHWGTGVASRMMDAVLAACADRTYSRAYLSAYEGSSRARGFYAKVGFRETGVTTESHFPAGPKVVDIEYARNLGEAPLGPANDR